MRRLAVTLTAVLALGLVATACENANRQAEQRQQEAIHKRLREQVPVPEIEGAAARDAIRRHLERWQDPNVVSYVTLFADTGQAIGYYEASGKVASTCQMLTKPDERVDSSSAVVQAPALDGTYYTDSECGVFFFTATGNTYVELSPDMTYVVTDQPLPIPDAEALEVESSDGEDDS